MFFKFERGSKTFAMYLGMYVATYTTLVHISLILAGIRELKLKKTKPRNRGLNPWQSRDITHI